jgi:type VI secretion system protein VasG
MGVNIRALVGKLNDTTREALNAAAGLCLARTHYNVEIEHFLRMLLDSRGNDADCILQASEVNRDRMVAELDRALDKLKSGNGQRPTFDPTIIKMLSEAWLIASIDFGSGQIRSGYVILALRADEQLSRFVCDMSKEFQKINPDALKKDFVKITSSSGEQAPLAAETAAASPRESSPATAQAVWWNIPPGRTAPVDFQNAAVDGWWNIPPGH